MAQFPKADPLPLGEGRVRVSVFAKICDPHPTRVSPLAVARRPLPEGEA